MSIFVYANECRGLVGPSSPNKSGDSTKKLNMIIDYLPKPRLDARLGLVKLDQLDERIGVLLRYDSKRPSEVILISHVFFACFDLVNFN